MDTGMQKLVPWESWHLWNEVREAIFSSSPTRVCAALDKIAAWRTRSSLPVSVEVTGDLIRIQRIDPCFSASSAAGCSVTNEMLCLMYAMSIMRLINGVVDQSKKQNTSSVAARAEAAGLPRILVDIRHEVAHQELPSLSYLQLASKQALEWLKDHYWGAQKLLLDEVQNGFHAKLHAYASLSETSENKAVLQLQVRQKLQVRRAKKLVTLSSPVVDLFGDSNNKADLNATNMTRPSGTPDHLDHMICNDELIDTEFQKSDHALSRAKKRLRSFYKSKHTILFSRSSADYDVPINTVDTFVSKCNSMNTIEKIAKGHRKEKSSRKEAWSVANDWKPCAIGMLPSKVHSAGVLPFDGSMFAGLARESACQGTVQRKFSSEVEAGVPTKEASGLVGMEDGTTQSDPVGERMSFVETETKEGPHRKADTEACQTAEKHSFKIDVKGHSDAKDGPLPHGKIKAPLPGGFLLLNGLYQRCGVDQLAAIRSSIEVLK